MYHTFESNTPQDMSPGSPARNILTPIAGAPHGYSGSESNAHQFLDKYHHVLQFAFLVDGKGAIHVTVGSVKELSKVTGNPMQESDK